MDNLHTPNCIRTNSGLYINVFSPTEDMICIEDIAHALSNQCRFGGHLDEFYSVAQHSFMCAVYAKPEDKFDALMHDASEAFILDIPTPIKAGLTNYKDIENNLMSVIASKYKFNFPLSQGVKDVDRMMLEFEWNHMVLGMPLTKEFSGFEIMSRTEAKNAFISLFHELSNEKWRLKQILQDEQF